MIVQTRRLLGILFALILTACGGPGHVSGDGDIHSLGGLNSADLEFNANSCTGVANSSGFIRLDDEDAIDWQSVGGVNIEGTVNETYYCDLRIDFNAPFCVCPTGYQEIRFSYQSTNLDNPGAGAGLACVVDVGDDESDLTEGGLSGLAEIVLSTGPYAGYHNAGATDVTQHDCTVAAAQ